MSVTATDRNAGQGGAATTALVVKAVELQGADLIVGGTTGGDHITLIVPDGDPHRGKGFPGPRGLWLIREPQVGGRAGDGRRATARPAEERVEAAARNQGDQRQNGEALHRRAVTTAIAAPASTPQTALGVCGRAATPV